MKIADVNGFEIHLPTSGGKAGKGHNKTSTIQVRKDGFLVKQFRFSVGSENRRLAIKKADAYAMNQPTKGASK